MQPFNFLKKTIFICGLFTIISLPSIVLAQTTAANTNKSVGSPVLRQPVGINAHAFTVNWIPDAGVASYILDVATLPDFSAPVFSFTIYNRQDVHSFTVNNLLAATKYYYRLRVAGSSTTTAVSSSVTTLTPQPLTSQPLTATLADALSNDVNNNNIVNPGDNIRYTTTITNGGTSSATGVALSEPPPANTTLVAGSLKSSALARDDNYSTSFNTVLAGSTVLVNDFGLPSVNVATFGTTLTPTTPAGSPGTSDAGGTLTVNVDGTFSYTPPAGFSGTDNFKYVASAGVPPNNAATVSITVAPDITFNTNNVNILCNGNPTGSITFTGVSGGSGAGYTYSITGAAGTYFASNVFNSLPAGTYNLAVKDGAGYIKTGTTSLTEPATAVTFTHTDVNNICNGGTAGSITFNASGGTGALTYSITGSSGSYFASNAFTGLAGGPYNLAVKDANGCVKTGSTTLTDPPAISFTTTNGNITCNGGSDGSITFNAGGGTGALTYSITGSGGTYFASNVFNSLSANPTYNLAVKDANGCIKTGTTALSEPAAIVISGTIPSLTYNAAMANATFSKTGGTGSRATPWSATGLPAGVTINTTTGVVSGTPLQTGSFSVTITYTDANGCTGTKNNVAFTVAPNLQNNAYNVVGNTQLVAGGQAAPTTPSTSDATNILTNDQADVTIVVIPGTFNTSVFGGSITIDALGRFVYTPPVGYTGADSYVYTGTANGVSATASISFNVAGRVWYVNNTYGGANGPSDGRSQRPFTTVNGAEAVASIAVHAPGNSSTTLSVGGDIIYVHTGSGITTGDALLKTGQTLRGAGSALNVGALSLAATAKPTLSGMITLANNVTVDGFDMSTGATTAFTNAGNTVTGVNVNVGNVTTSTGIGINLTGTGNSVTMMLASLTTTAQANNGVVLTNTAGTVTINGGSIIGGSGAPFLINGSSASVTDNGSISQNNATRIVDVQNKTGGTVTFNGTVSCAGGCLGIYLNANTGATINFTNTISLSTNVNPAFTATGGGTVNASGTGSNLSTTTATALNVDNTTIGAGNLNFLSINTSASSANPGIVLNTTGSLGGLIVSGTGTSAGSGGTISGKTKNGVMFTSTKNLTLKNMNITGNGTSQNVGGAASNCGGAIITGDNISCVANVYIINSTNATFDNVSITGSGQQGLNGNAVNGLTLNNCTISGNGNESFESGVLLKDITGTVTITGTNIIDNHAYEMDLSNSSGTMTLNASNSSFGRSAAAPGDLEAQAGMLLQLQGSSSATLNLSSLTLSNNVGTVFNNAFWLNAQGSSIVNGSITGSTFDNNAACVVMNANDAASVTFNTMNNPVMTNNALQAIVYAVLGGGAPGAVTASLTGTISGNNIGTASAPGCAIGQNCDAIDINSGTEWAGQMHLKIDGNTIQKVSGGIETSLDGSASFTPQVHLRVINNNLSNPLSGSADAAIRMSAATTSTHPNIFVCWDAGGTGVGNTITGAWSVGSALTSIYLRQRFSGNGSIKLPGYGGTSTDDNAVLAYLLGRNSITAPGSPAGYTAGIVSHTGTTPFTGGTSCSTPLLLSNRRINKYPISKVESVGNTSNLSGEQLQLVVNEALTIWQAVGLNGRQMKKLRETLYSVDVLAPGKIGAYSIENDVSISRDAGGKGWYVGVGVPGSHIDLLTSVLHEMGHVLGLKDLKGNKFRNYLMYGKIDLGKRKLPTKEMITSINIQ